MPHIQAGELSVYYERAGVGPRLLFISGTGRDLRQQPNAFGSPFPDHFDVVGYDQRGMGQTEKPPGPYTMAKYADDAAALMDALGWEDAHIVGVSFGGMVAQELALRHPARVQRLVLMCTSSGGQGGSSFPLHELEGMRDDERARATIAVADIRRGSAWQALHPEETAKIVEGFIAAEEAFAHEPGWAEGRALQIEARKNHDVYDRLDKVAAPTLVAGGHYDGIAPPENQRAIAGRIPEAELAFFEGGHFFRLQDKAAYPRMIEFLLG